VVVKLVANGMSPDEIVREYPDLEPEDIREPRGVKLLAEMGISMPSEWAWHVTHASA